MSEHTPGPWITREADGAIAIAQDGHLPHATVYERSSAGDVDETVRADARLMAGALAMWEALQRIAAAGPEEAPDAEYDDTEEAELYGHESGLFDAAEMARAALAAVEGTAEA